MEMVYAVSALLRHKDSAMSFDPQRMKDRRNELGLTQTQLAEKLGVKQSQIGRYENGERIPMSDALARLAEALGVLSSWLLGETDLKTLPSMKELTAEERLFVDDFLSGRIKMSDIKFAEEIAKFPQPIRNEIDAFIRKLKKQFGSHKK